MKWGKFFTRKKANTTTETTSEKTDFQLPRPSFIIDELYPPREHRLYSKSVKSILAIPGTWQSYTEFILALVKASNGEFIAAGNILINAQKERDYVFEFCDRNDQVSKAIAFTGKSSGIDELALEGIAAHSSIVYLSIECRSEVDTGHLAFAAGAVLSAGGLGINVETAGKGFDKTFWLEQLAFFRLSTLHKLFVIDPIILEDGSMYSCGMHNLGLKDTIVGGLSVQDAHDLINIFSIYQIVDKPIILSGQTFTPTPQSPMFRITEELAQPYKGVDLFENPFDMWRLTSI